jgi:hypothetical protein
VQQYLVFLGESSRNKQESGYKQESFFHTAALLIYNRSVKVNDK